MKRRDFLNFVCYLLYELLVSQKQAFSKSELNMNKINGMAPLIFAVTNTCNWVISERKRVNLFDYDFVDGVSNYVRWAEIEPQKGKYNFIGFERLSAEAKKADKKLSYHILAGVHAPKWLYTQENIKSYTYHLKNGKIVTTYLPWTIERGKRILNEDFFKIWQNTIFTFSKFINNHSEKERIHYISITGGPTSNGLEIMWAQENYDEFSMLSFDTESKDIFINFWKRVIDIFIEAFPNYRLGLAFTDFFGVSKNGEIIRDIEIPRQILNYAINLGKRKKVDIIPMGLWIGSVNLSNTNHPLINLLLSQGRFALQGPMGTPSLEKLKEQLNFAIESGALWIELWHHDIINKSYHKLFNEFRNRKQMTHYKVRGLMKIGL